MIEFFVACKHIRKRKFQTLVSILSICISLTVFVISLSISNGLKENMINSILTISPHIKVYSDNLDNVKEKIKDMDILKIYESRSFKGFVNINNETIFPIIQATELEKLDIKLVDYSETKKANIAYIGQEFAKNNGLKIGDTINIVSLKGKEISLEISKIFKTSYLAYDANLVLIPIEVANILDLENNDTNLNIMIKNPSNIKKIEKISNDIQNIDENTYTQTWADENNNLLNAMKFEEFVLVAILSMLLLISTFVIVVVLNISVREKTRDIGILKSMSYSKSFIRNIFILNAIICAIIGMALSLILSPIVVYILKIIFKTYISSTYYIDALPVVYNFKQILFIYVFAFIIILLSSIIPANKAAKLDVVEAIKFNL